MSQVCFTLKQTDSRELKRYQPPYFESFIHEKFPIEARHLRAFTLGLHQIMNMADKTSLTSMFCALCLLVFINGFRVDCTDISSSFGTCDTEESEDDFCESGDGNLYLTNVKVSTEDSQKAKPERVVASKIYSEATATEEISKGEVNDSLSEHQDKQIQDTDNSTNDWLGLQIPLVDGVRVCLVLFPFFILFEIVSQMSFNASVWL